ncbi:chemotaxis protein [Bacillus alkalicellulosilyticus]|uniref:chemotaxis protein n=1 Tax=Alkalihalobacterium alkalicellulosilyticum TaxID=1912214 RepID=UPI000996F157|nr:chemotaxis protein [Bacillus alkalicellulosilyticus]
MNYNNKKGILLESGTNELEIIVFSIGDEMFGINVLKVREIINPLPITKMPNSHPNVEGIIRLRDMILPVINLGKVLNFPVSNNPEKDKLVVVEFNNIKAAFHVDDVSRIHRISWEQIEKPSEVTQGLEQSTIGVIKLDDEMVLLLDYEKIVVEIAPEVGINKNSIKELGPRERSDKRIVIAEDSAVLRRMIEDTLADAGYHNVYFFDNGKTAWEYLETLSEKGRAGVEEAVQLIITDLEMPQMDGHHLTKRIKDSDVLRGLPVVIFSSLITGELKHKGKLVGADAQISKPEIARLVETIDKLIL